MVALQLPLAGGPYVAEDVAMEELATVDVWKVVGDEEDKV